ncbi:hypothetical protein [Caulobacter segnis]
MRRPLRHDASHRATSGFTPPAPLAGEVARRR